MLDQNTDRMWYVIGAVIIGAAIILIMNKTFPQLFASVGDTFTSKTEQTTSVVDGILPNYKAPDITYLGPADVNVSDGASVLNFNEAEHMWTMTVNSVPVGSPWHHYAGLRMNTQRFIIPYGKSVLLTYDVYVDKSVTTAKAVTDINTEVLDSTIPNWGGNDNDTNRSYNGTSQPGIDLVGGKWTSITVRYVNDSIKNTQQATLYDRSHIGVQIMTGETITIKLRNARFVIEE